MAAGAEPAVRQPPAHSSGARLRAGALASADGRAGGLRSLRTARPVGRWAFLGVAVASFGGPLALAALGAPGLFGDASASAGLGTVAAVAVFAAPLAIWLRFSGSVRGSGGLAAFVEAAAGRRLALTQAAIWTFSYVLYLAYTTVQIVYDLLPAVLPGERSYQSLLALMIPAALVAVMLAGRAATLLVLGVVAAGQIALAGVLDGITLAHVSAPASTFAAGAGTGALAKATAQSSLLYVCGSLPLFLGGEVAGGWVIRRGVSAAFVLTGVVVLLAVAPLAAAPGLLNTAIPGFTVAQEFARPAVANAIGIGVAVSVAGVMLCEYLALSRLLYAVGGWPVRRSAGVIGAVLLLAAPISLINPDRFYRALLKPSLVALWLSQLIVFAVYPRFARRRGQAALPAWGITLVAVSLALYALWTTLGQASS